MPKKQNWYIYILECSDGSFYTGITTDIERRIIEHNDGSGARYTRTRRPVHVVFKAGAANRSVASSIEARIKRLSRKKKIQLIATGNLSPLPPLEQ